MAIKSNNKIVIWCAVLSVIFFSGHVFYTIFTGATRVILLLGAIALLLELVRLRNMKLDRVQLAALLFCLMVGLTCVACLGQGASLYIILACYILAGYSLARLYSFRQIAECHVKIMTVVTVIAIVGYVLVQNTTVLNALPQMANLNGVEYRIAGIFNYIPEVANRNCGMFWEPGLFATQLIISIILEIMLQEKPSFWRLLVFAVGIVTANSSAGFALLFFCIILLILKKADPSKNALATLGGIIAILVGTVIVLNFDKLLAQTALGDNEFFQKLSTENILDSSRMNAIGHNLEMFLAAPIFGQGFIRVSANIRYVADTSTSTYLMSVFGIFGAMYTVYWGYVIFKLPKVNILAKVMIFIITMVILNKEPHHQNLLTWCLLFSLVRGDFSKKDSKGKEEKQPKLRIKWR